MFVGPDRADFDAAARAVAGHENRERRTLEEVTWCGTDNRKEEGLRLAAKTWIDVRKWREADLRTSPDYVRL